ncbi:hypothetical protein M422DRAFT_45745 [Sphaerobolus stellatus SS14]|nr:hypothetical protein M422DRAFT_45745 [Sphaerobolus stellatus SS14]
MVPGMKEKIDASYCQDTTQKSSATKMRYSDYTGLPALLPISPQLESLELPPLNGKSNIISYMTDDHPPIVELWQFEKSGEATVRFAIDPVMRQANPKAHGSMMGLFHELSQTGLLTQSTDFT